MGNGYQLWINVFFRGYLYLKFKPKCREWYKKALRTPSKVQKRKNRQHWTLKLVFVQHTPAYTFVYSALLFKASVPCHNTLLNLKCEAESERTWSRKSTDACLWRTLPVKDTACEGHCGTCLLCIRKVLSHFAWWNWNENTQSDEYVCWC